MRRGYQQGFTLIELMVALVLGLLIVAAVVSVLLSNKQVYNTNNSLTQVQDSSRIAFELLARDIRHSSLTGCGNTSRIANVLNNGPIKAPTATAWYANYANAMLGFDGGTTDAAVTSATAPNPPATNGQRVSTSSSIRVITADGLGATVASNDTTNAKIVLNEASSNLSNGDIFVVCDPDHAAVAQLSGYAVSGTTVTLTYASGVGTPGNCVQGLGFPTSCTTANNYAYAKNAQIAKVYAADWYVGYNPLGGTSLYRTTLVNTANVPAPVAQEMVRNVSNLLITYHWPGQNSYRNAAAVGTNWGQVDSVAISFTFQSTGTNTTTNAGQPLTRTLTSVVTLRNRV